MRARTVNTVGPVYAQGYSPVGEVAPSAVVEAAEYTFSVSPVYSAYREQAWQRFADNGDPGNTVLLNGMGGYDSYALSALRQPKPSAPVTAMASAKAAYSDISFTVHPVARDCAVMDPGPPVPLAADMVALAAHCVDPRTGEVFELIISWKSMLLRVNEVPGAAQAGANVCGGEPGQSKEAACKPRFDQMRAAMDTFVGSFRFKPAG